jgi:spermidine/putrescine transport system permease protein
MKNIKKLFYEDGAFFISIPAIFWQVLFVILPLSILFISSFLTYQGNLTRFSFDQYRLVFNLTHFYVIARSLLLAFFNSILCLIFAYPVAYYLSIRVTRFKSLSLFFVALPFWINFLVHIYSWFFILDNNGLLNNFLINFGFIDKPLHFINTIGSMILVMFHGYLPFMILPLYTVLEKLDKRLIEASLDLGANRTYTFFKIVLPLSYSGASAGFFLVFVLSFGEFLIPSLLGGGKTLFVGTLISEYFLVIRSVPQGAAFTFLSAAMLCLGLLFSHILLKYFFKGK